MCMYIDLCFDLDPSLPFTFKIVLSSSEKVVLRYLLLTSLMSFGAAKITSQT